MRLEPIVGWDADFVKVDQATLFEMILAANLLDIEPMLNLTCKAGETSLSSPAFFSAPSPPPAPAQSSHSGESPEHCGIACPPYCSKAKGRNCKTANM